MHIDIISAVPELLEGPFGHSIIGRAASRDLFTVSVHDLKDYGLGRLHQIDDYAYGGGAGMVMMCEPLHKAIDALVDAGGSYDQIIFMTPDAPVLHQRQANRLSLYKRLLIICGHYKGIDQRIRDHLVTMEVSIGDYVLSGGELAAAVLVDAIGRLIPGVMNDGSSALSDSHQDGLLAPPVYTRPAEYNGWKVPDVLLSGHEAKIEAWRSQQSLDHTRTVRPDLLDDAED